MLHHGKPATVLSYDSSKAYHIDLPTVLTVRLVSYPTAAPTPLSQLLSRGETAVALFAGPINVVSTNRPYRPYRGRKEYFKYFYPMDVSR